MTDPRAARFLAEALAGRLSRRQALSLGLRLGLASPVITAAMAAAAEASPAAAAPRPAARAPRAQDEAGGGAGGGTLTVVVPSGFSDLDPHVAYDNISSMFFMATYEMLIRLEGESTDRFAPMLAESWEASPDQATYTFKLAPNARFHDGSPCDAAAVQGSFARFLLQGDGPVNVIGRFVSDPAQIEAVDPVTVRFNLGRPQPLFLPAMASEYGPFVIDPKQVEANKTDEDPFAHEWFQENTAGTGPYKVDRYEPNDSTVLSRFEEYHRGWEGAHFDQIVIRVVPENASRRQLLERGEADALTFYLTPDEVAALSANPDLRVLTYDSTNVNWVVMNAPRLKTVEARQGFSHAFPYQQVVEGAYKGLIERTSGPIPTSVRGYDPQGFLYQTDVARARELILAGGFAEGDGFEYMVSSDNATEVTVAQLFQANVQEAGFALEIVEVDGATFNNLAYGDAPAEDRPHFFGGWGWWPDYNDPWNQLAPNFRSREAGGTNNAGYWSNPRFDELMAEAETYTDEARLAELMREAQRIMTEQDPPAIYYGQLKWYTALRADIQGYYNNPLYLGSYPFYEMHRAGGS